MAITNIQIKNAKSKEKKYKLSCGGGLSVLVMPTGSKLWKFRFRMNGKESDYSLGSFGDGRSGLSLKEAHLKADDLRVIVKQGIHPKEADRKHAQKKRLEQKNTFKAVSLAWIETKANSWKPNHKKDVERSLNKHIYPYLGDVAVSDITTADVLHVLRKLEATGALVMLSKINQRVSHIFTFACIEGMIKSNPATNLQTALKSPVSTNFKHVPINELPELLRKIDDYDKITGVYVVTRLAMQLLSLVFIRTGELRQLKWSHISFDKALIEIPPELMKMGNPHIVPLSTQALDIIEQLKAFTGDSEYLFCQQNNKHKPMSENAVLYALYSLGYHGKMTGHGFRHVASTQLNEMGFRADLIEKQLAHGDSNKVRAVYNKAQYLPERAEMMQSWSDYIEAIKKGADVVPINKSKGN